MIGWKNKWDRKGAGDKCKDVWLQMGFSVEHLIGVALVCVLVYVVMNTGLLFYST